jgi:Ferritin-like
MLRIQEFADKSEIIPVYSDPYLELIRLLREAAEIEHALMVQYLYAAFSVDPHYPKLSGLDAGNVFRRPPKNPTADDLDFGVVAVQEMHHLGAVSSFLREIGGSPELASQDFPFEPDIYPFALHLEPLTQKSVTKYVYAEASQKDLDNSDKQFVQKLNEILGNVRPNHVGSLYDTLIKVIDQIEKKKQTEPSYLSFITDDPKIWTKIWTDMKDKLEKIRDEGTGPHFEFFKSVFLGTHVSLKDIPNVWSPNPSDQKYPSVGLPTDPSAFKGSDNEIKDKKDRELAYLSNLHYWITLISLEAFYRYNLSGNVLGFAINHMTNTLLPLGKHLAIRSVGLPFDSSPLGYDPGNTPDASKEFVQQLLQEASIIAERRKLDLPSDLDLDIYNLNSIPDFKK